MLLSLYNKQLRFRELRARNLLSRYLYRLFAREFMREYACNIGYIRAWLPYKKVDELQFYEVSNQVVAGKVWKHISFGEFGGHVYYIYPKKSKADYTRLLKLLFKEEDYANPDWPQRKS